MSSWRSTAWIADRARHAFDPADRSNGDVELALLATGVVRGEVGVAYEAKAEAIKHG